MTMMAHINQTIKATRCQRDVAGFVYFQGNSKRFDKLEMSDDGEVLLASWGGEAKTAIRIASIDAIDMLDVFQPSNELGN